MVGLIKIGACNFGPDLKEKGSECLQGTLRWLSFDLEKSFGATKETPMDAVPNPSTFSFLRGNMSGQYLASRVLVNSRVTDAYWQ